MMKRMKTVLVEVALTILEAHLMMSLVRSLILIPIPTVMMYLIRSLRTRRISPSLRPSLKKTKKLKSEASTRKFSPKRKAKKTVKKVQVTVISDMGKTVTKATQIGLVFLLTLNIAWF
jgi:hypothetical protein